MPLEYLGRERPASAGWPVLALGVQSFHENSSPFYPTDPGKQSAMQAAFGNAATYPARNVFGPSFAVNGQLEYQLDNGFSIGGLAGVNNAQNFTEGVGKVYLRKNFGLEPSTSFLPRPLSGSL